MDYPRQTDCGRVSLWVKDSKAGDKFLSGVIEFFDPEGEVYKVQVRVFKNNKRNERSADFYGSISVPEESIGDMIEICEKEPQQSAPSKKAVRKPSAQRSKVAAFENEVPIF
jgi:hypothetical protein